MNRDYEAAEGLILADGSTTTRLRVSLHADRGEAEAFESFGMIKTTDFADVMLLGASQVSTPFELALRREPPALLFHGVAFVELDRAVLGDSWCEATTAAGGTWVCSSDGEGTGIIGWAALH